MIQPTTRRHRRRMVRTGAGPRMPPRGRRGLVRLPAGLPDQVGVALVVAVATPGPVPNDQAQTIAVRRVRQATPGTAEEGLQGSRCEQPLDRLAEHMVTDNRQR